MKALIILFVLLSNLLYANIAKITTLNGEVNILRDKETLKASKNFQIQLKDIIKTNKDANAQLLFTDNTIISVGYNSTFSIDEYVNDSNKPPKVKFGLKKGFFKSITGNIGKLNPDRFKLKTKSASIGIRGTTILAKVENGNEKIICTEGAIRVSNKNGWSDVKAGEMTFVKNGAAPTIAVLATAEDIEELEKASGAKGQDEDEEEESSNSNQMSQYMNSQNLSTYSNNLTNLDSPYENDLASNSNVSNDVYYYSSLTNFYNQSNDVFNSKQRLIKKSTTDPSLSTTDGSIGNYLSWGHWGVTNDTSEAKSDYNGSTYEGRSYWISGILTPASDVPKSGSATYTGSITGNIVRDASNSYKVGSTVSGTTTMTANFGSNTMSGTFNVSGFANANLNNVKISRQSYGATFSGNLTGARVNSGQVSGAFYGDNAAAVGGLWVIEDNSQNVADGTFSATK